MPSSPQGVFIVVLAIARRPGFEGGTRVALQLRIGGIAAAICLDTGCNVESHDSIDLILRFGVKYSG